MSAQQASEINAFTDATMLVASTEQPVLITETRLFPEVPKTTEGLPVDRTVPLAPSNLPEKPVYTFHPTNSFGARAAQTASVVGSRIGESFTYAAEKLGMKKPTETMEKVEREAGVLNHDRPEYVTETIEPMAYKPQPKPENDFYGIPLPAKHTKAAGQ